jgi:glycosyltransferase involved in cell wall biosynthesis
LELTKEKKLKIIFLTFYYQPDLGAGSFRASALVNALANLKTKGLEIDVITTHPNRYKSQIIDKIKHDLRSNITVHRIKLPSHKSGLIDQAFAFCFFAYKAFFLSRKLKPQLVIATSSRLMTAFLGFLISKFNSVPLYLDIRDIFTDVIKNIGSKTVMIFLFPVFKLIEKITFKRASQINVVSEGFSEHIKKINPKCKLTVHMNGVDSEFIGYDFNKSNLQLGNKKIILYAGNIGEGQGLHKIIPNVAKHLEQSVIFRIIGDGGMRAQLRESLEHKDIKNVEILNPMPRNRLLSYYKEADILFLHLNDFEAFTKVIPSKLFEYSCTGKPILAGLNGVSSVFIKDNIDGAEVFTPCNTDGFLNSYRKLNSKTNSFDRSNFSKEFSRKTIMKNMAKEIVKLLNDSKLSI